MQVFDYMLVDRKSGLQRTHVDKYIKWKIVHDMPSSRGTKVEKMLTLAPERYIAGFCMVAKVILWCI